MESFNMSKDKIIKIPMDTILEGVIVNVEKTTWAKIINPVSLNKFENPDEQVIKIHYEVKVEDKILKGDDVYKYYENPMSNSKLGKFLTKYEDLSVGKIIKIVYSSQGIPNIKID